MHMHRPRGRRQIWVCGALEPGVGAGAVPRATSGIPPCRPPARERERESDPEQIVLPACIPIIQVLLPRALHIARESRDLPMFNRSLRIITPGPLPRFFSRSTRLLSRCFDGPDDRWCCFPTDGCGYCTFLRVYIWSVGCWLWELVNNAKTKGVPAFCPNVDVHTRSLGGESFFRFSSLLER